MQLLLAGGHLLRERGEVELDLLGLTGRFEGGLALEPRHASWFEPDAEDLVASYRIARVAANPAVIPSVAEPGGWDGLVYYRLHGSPRVYYSAYSVEYLEALVTTSTHAAKSAEVWCIFDNTAAFAATVNALDILDRVRAGSLWRPVASMPEASF